MWGKCEFLQTADSELFAVIRQENEFDCLDQLFSLSLDDFDNFSSNLDRLSVYDALLYKLERLRSDDYVLVLPGVN